ncbi:patatin-like phospholipase domain-containing protein 4 [Ruditapes philippinarum]|uniref:patatin-like phospholipase domain-containing protein 4 n=1 Tax=Ruditapes philippinarum TaxID=129788 RepID=UPI00295C03C4|nr:patatin-like phospholipase domain-containing protein 4 [Ruditapes philippinarum]
MNLSLCGSGFLGIYHIGVAKALINHAPVFLSKIDRVGGASAGALVGAILVCDPNKLDLCRKFNLDQADALHKKLLGGWTPRYNVLKPVKEFMITHMPEDSYKKANNTLYISLTKLVKGSYSNEVMSTYSSNRQLFECLYATCYVPLYVGGTFPVIDGHKFIDGGLTNNLVTFNEGRTVTVSPFSGDQDICPADDKRRKFIRIGRQNFGISNANRIRFQHALSPPHKDKLLEYYDDGYFDAVSFLKKEGFYEK